MKRKLLFKVVAGSILVIIVTIIIINKSHPIILNWVSGSARIIGKPIHAIVYTNGKINNDIKVYRITSYWEGGNTNDYLLSLKEYDKYGVLKFINIDLKEKWVGRPVGTSKDDYDIINGYLFQSEVGSHFVDFKDDMKGFNLDPQLTHTGNQISFRVPPAYLGYNSIRIQLN
jgi:hypothetical protein